MSDVWTAIIHVYQNSGGSREAAGDPVQRFSFPADDIEDALRVASAIARGIKTNPAVGQAPILALTVRA